jgi:hypothetical protein
MLFQDCIVVIVSGKAKRARFGFAGSDVRAEEVADAAGTPPADGTLALEGLFRTSKCQVGDDLLITRDIDSRAPRSELGPVSVN